MLKAKKSSQSRMLPSLGYRGTSNYIHGRMEELSSAAHSQARSLLGYQSPEPSQAPPLLGYQSPEPLVAPAPSCNTTPKLSGVVVPLPTLPGIVLHARPAWVASSPKKSAVPSLPSLPSLSSLKI